MPFKILVVWQLINFLIDSTNQICIKIYHNNALLTHAVGTIEYITYAIIYYHLFISQTIKRVVLYSIPVVIIFSIINAIFFQPYTKTHPTNELMTESILEAIFAILLFKQMLQYPVKMNVMKQSVFWFNAAMLFSSTTMFLNLGLMNYYGKYHEENLALIFYFWYGIDVIFSILLIIAILNDNREFNETQPVAE